MAISKKTSAIKARKQVKRQESLLTSPMRGVGRKLVGSPRLLRLQDAVTVFTWGVICVRRDRRGREREERSSLEYIYE